MMKAAFHVARTGRCGPVLVDVPRDIQEAELDFTLPGHASISPGWRPPRKVHPLQIREAAERIARAEKPVLYVGGGTINGDACDELRATRGGRRPPGDHDADGQGRVPRDPSAVLRLAGHARHEVVEHRDEHLRRPRRDRRPLRRPCHRASCRRSRPGATVVHLDIDPAEISKLRDADIPVVGPLKKALAELTVGIVKHREAGVPGARGVGAQDRGVADEFPLRYGTGGDWLKPQRLLETLQALTAGDDVIFTTGVGQHQMWAMQYLLIERPRNFITSGGLGTMGYGIPAAVGAKAARPEATVVCVDGDGCFQMTAQELTTAVIDELPIVVVLVNNGYLGMVTQWQDMFFDGRRSHVGLGVEVPDYVKLAEAYGGVGMLVETEAELEPALREALSLGRTVVIDCRVDPAEQCFPMIPAGAAAIDMVEYQDPVEATP